MLRHAPRLLLLLLLAAPALPQAAQWPSCPAAFSLLALHLGPAGEFTSAQPLAGDPAFLERASEAAQGITFAPPLEGSTLGLFCAPATAPRLGYIFHPESIRGAAPQSITESAALAHLTHKQPPDYPAMAKARNIRSPVVLTVVIGLQGEVAAAAPLSGPPELYHAALAAVRQWAFTPFPSAAAPANIVASLRLRFYQTR